MRGNGAGRRPPARWAEGLPGKEDITDNGLGSAGRRRQGAMGPTSCRGRAPAGDFRGGVKEGWEGRGLGARVFDHLSSRHEEAGSSAESLAPCAGAPRSRSPAAGCVPGQSGEEGTCFASALGERAPGKHRVRWAQRRRERRLKSEQCPRRGRRHEGGQGRRSTRGRRWDDGMQARGCEGLASGKDGSDG
jgi:hypothetical protein